MEELKNLQKMSENAVARFNSYSGADFVLPSIFKEQVKSINSNTIIYNQYSAIIETAGNQNGILKIYMPNQWFYIASYFTEYYNELLKYKKVALEITTKERLKILNGNQLTDEEKQAISTLQCSDESKSNLIRFITDYSWWGGAKTIDRGDFYVSPILSLARLVNASQSFVADLCAFLSDKQNLVQAIIDGESGAENNIKEVTQTHSYTLQQIFYGAPGTGKSHTINELTANEDVIRTTFHPDTDYSTFVGAYKPTTIEETVMTVIGTKAVAVENEDGSKRKETKIVYEFVAQAFLQAYIAAWRKYAGAGENEPKKQFLVIEEINRGNCAQIFGDLFQLLDRNESGFSEYPIKADADMQKQLKKELYGLSVVNADEISALYNNRNVVSEVFNGDILLLPDNLYIWATMNTSDQSLFPIDSAFKRRWDWKYIPISNANKGWTIKVNGNKYDWWNFLEKINTQIGSTTNSEDKKLGYFFCKAINNEISAETFVGKVMFYLWNDVFKDYDFDNNIFKDDNGETMTFDKFYTAESKDAKVKEETVEAFLKKLGVDATGQQGDDENNNVPNNISIRVNGKEVKYINAVPYTAVEEYVKMHPEMSAQQVIDVWEPFKKCSMRSWIVCNKEEHDSMEPKYANYSYEIKCSDGNSIWVNKDGWMHYPENQKLRDTINEFMSAVNNSDLGITITEIPA